MSASETTNNLETASPATFETAFFAPVLTFSFLFSIQISPRMDLPFLALSSVGSGLIKLLWTSAKCFSSFGLGEKALRVALRLLFRGTLIKISPAQLLFMGIVIYLKLRHPTYSALL
ncbi:hypothetical protein TYRP_018203 [Tyrophagus putrescentiae]|nr:hypothetical protein TYRP_018203 [Tyrophagus putrescentiae]